MEYVLKNSIHTVIGETILADIRSQRTAYYFFVGGSDVAGQSYDKNADDTYKFELTTRNEIVSMKRMLASDVSFVINRIDWASGQVFDHYADYSPTFPAKSGATKISDARFYVLTNDNRVYKCLWNNNGAVSTVKPASTLAAAFNTADGYRWQYMYSVPLSSRTKFLNSRYMPVQTALTANFYSSGSITGVTLVSMGTGYTTASINVAGDGVGAVLTPVLSAGQIVGVTVDNPGSGYTYANITVTGDGTGANISAQLAVGDLNTSQTDVELLAVAGTIEAYNVVNQGSGYSTASVVIQGDGKGASATPTIVNGKITKIVVNQPGQGYTYANITIVGTGAGATANAVMSPYGGHGKNAINELYASRISFYSNILNDKNQGVEITNNFRNVGLVRNVKEYGSERYYNSMLGSACNVLVCSGPLAANDAMLTVRDTGQRFRVVQQGESITLNGVPGVKYLMQNLDNYDIKGNTVLINSNGGAMTIMTVTPPNVNKFSGEMLFIDNTGVDQQAGQQVIIFKTTLKF